MIIIINKHQGDYSDDMLLFITETLHKIINIITTTYIS